MSQATNDEIETLKTPRAWRVFAMDDAECILPRKERVPPIVEEVASLEVAQARKVQFQSYGMVATVEPVFPTPQRRGSIISRLQIMLPIDMPAGARVMKGERSCS